MADNQALESLLFPGFYEIPNFDNYAISLKGEVINKTTHQLLKGSINTDGYLVYRLKDNSGKTTTLGRYRLLCYVFKPPVDPSSIKHLVINHINGIKSDDRLDNLEWCTYRENIEHAGANGLTSKCLPISVRDVGSGHVVNYPSIIECARENNMTKDAVRYRVLIGEHRVFPERKQYRLSTDAEWFIPPNIEHEILKNGTSKSVDVRDVLTGKVTTFKQITKLAECLKVSPSTLSHWLRYSNQPILPGFIQMKWTHDTTPWRDVDDAFKEVCSFSGKKPVVTISKETGEKRIFGSAIECAKAMGIKPTALNYRLKANSKRFFSDGYQYSYL